MSTGSNQPILKRYFYQLLSRYISFYVRPEDSLVEIDPRTFDFASHFQQIRYFFTGSSPIGALSPKPVLSTASDLKKNPPDYFLLSGNIHFEKDITGFFDHLHSISADSSRFIILYFSRFWMPFMKLATFFGCRTKSPEENWITHEDMENFLAISNFEIVRSESKILIPAAIPWLSDFFNRWIAPLPFFKIFTLVNIVVARPVGIRTAMVKPSVSIVVPARNESGNIENIIQRIPKMGPEDEIVFVEGHSTDDTWDKILAAQKKYTGEHRIVAVRQEGKGKGDAVRKGFSIAQNPVLMILDADLTVPPEELPKFYRVFVASKGEFINGSRLVYPMEKKAMQLLNIFGNKFFARLFSFLLGQKFRDTLCGTKVLSRQFYLRLAKNRSYFGDFDPFGDFDLIFGAARLGLKIIELPIRYRERTYGSTNIRRWRHGLLLLQMSYFAARRIKFI